jgi:hypothetical protein
VQCPNRPMPRFFPACRPSPWANSAVAARQRVSGPIGAGALPSRRCTAKRCAAGAGREVRVRSGEAPACGSRSSGLEEGFAATLKTCACIEAQCFLSSGAGGQHDLVAIRCPGDVEGGLKDGTAQCRWLRKPAQIRRHGIRGGHRQRLTDGGGVLGDDAVAMGAG